MNTDPLNQLMPRVLPQPVQVTVLSPVVVVAPQEQVKTELSLDGDFRCHVVLQSRALRDSMQQVIQVVDQQGDKGHAKQPLLNVFSQVSRSLPASSHIPDLPPQAHVHPLTATRTVHCFVGRENRRTTGTLKTALDNALSAMALTALATEGHHLSVCHDGCTTSTLKTKILLDNDFRFHFRLQPQPSISTPNSSAGRTSSMPTKSTGWSRSSAFRPVAAHRQHLFAQLSTSGGGCASGGGGERAAESRRSDHNWYSSPSSRSLRGVHRRSIATDTRQRFPMLYSILY